MEAKIPAFTRIADGPLLDLTALPWGKTIMFPTVVDMSAYLKRPINRFYLYYAPHHNGGGIGLATAPHPEGPWRTYQENPIFTLSDASGFTGHISSPELIFIPEKNIFYVYFHGKVEGIKGQHTGLVMSEDGVNFKIYGQGPILPSDSSSREKTGSAAYLRVFRRDGIFYGAYMSRGHRLARSADGIKWEHWPKDPLIALSEADSEYDRIRHASVLIFDDILAYFYSTYSEPAPDREVIKLATFPIKGEWKGWGPLRRWGEVLAPELAWEQNNLRDPFLLRYEDKLYMYYVGGNEKGIALAVTDYQDFSGFIESVRCVE